MKSYPCDIFYIIRIFLGFLSDEETPIPSAYAIQLEYSVIKYNMLYK